MTSLDEAGRGSGEGFLGPLQSQEPGDPFLFPSWFIPLLCVLCRYPGRAHAITNCYLAQPQSVNSGKSTPPMMDHERLESPNDQAEKLSSEALPGPSQLNMSSPPVPLVKNFPTENTVPAENTVSKRPSISERPPSPLFQPCPILETARDGEWSGSLSHPEVHSPLQPRARKREVPDKPQADPMCSTPAAKAPKNRVNSILRRLRSCCCCCCPKQGGSKASSPYMPRFRPTNAAMLNAFDYRNDLWEN